MLGRNDRRVLTVLSLPAAISTEGLSVMNDPSTTGTKLSRPKKLVFATATLTFCKSAAERALKQAIASEADEHLAPSTTWLNRDYKKQKCQSSRHLCLEVATDILQERGHCICIEEAGK